MDAQEYIELRRKPFLDRLDRIADYLEAERKKGNLMGRIGSPPTDTKMRYQDPITGECHEMLIFGSNNYLGLANDPEIKTKVQQAIAKYGLGTGGSPAFSGYTEKHQEVEQRLAGLSGHEAALLLAGGYLANLCWISGLMTRDDILLYDKCSHASVINAIKMANISAYTFDADNLETLENLILSLRGKAPHNAHLFITMEGVRSIDGSVADLKRAVSIYARHRDKVTFMLDDAHGLGTLGERGHGTLEHLNLKGQVDLRMSTCSKAMGIQGAFLTGSRKMIQYMRVTANPYVFTTALSQPIVAAILAGLDFMEEHPERLRQLHTNVTYMHDRLEKMGYRIHRGPAGIIPVFIPNAPATLINRALHRKGLFANVMEYPMVPPSKERIRLSIMATHTCDEMDNALQILQEVGKDFGIIA